MQFIKCNELSILILITLMVCISFLSAILSHTNAVITPPKPIELNNNPYGLSLWTSHLAYYKTCDTTGCTDLSLTCNFNQAFHIVFRCYIPGESFLTLGSSIPVNLPENRSRLECAKKIQTAKFS